jgi:exodeoxyribonuclease-5
LNEVFRQALDSPILAAITSLRCGGPAGPRAGQQDYVARIGERGDVARLALQATAEEEDVVAITWRNIDRQTINGVVRRGLGHRDELPESGEPLMVLANAHRIGLMNGEIVRLAGYAWGEKTWPILEYQEEPRGIRASVDVAGLQISVILVVDFLATDGRLPTDLRPGDLYRRRLGVPEATKQAMLVVDYGYAATAHKAQGSEWEHAIVHVPAEICKWPDHRRWIYTAMSRARSRLTVVYGRGLSSMFT